MIARMPSPSDRSVWQDRIDAAIGGATAILGTVGWRDFPEGVVVIARPLASGHLGLTWGTGHALAAANGEVMGRRGFFLDPVQTALAYGFAGVEVTALHELAHQLHATADIDNDQADAAPTIDLTETVRSLEAARTHHPGWAAAFAVYVRRAMQFRSGDAALMGAILDYQLRKYGYAGADAVLEGLGPVADDEPLRPILDFQSARMAKLFAALPFDHQRAAVIAAAGHYQE
jgi:hypothetical protein